MVMIAICSSLIGAVLGTRLKVLALLPAMLVGFALVLAVALINDAPASTALGAAAVWAICLQLGYCGGLLTRYCLTGSQMTSERPVRSHLTIVE
jgi:hypothetical protein